MKSKDTNQPIPTTMTSEWAKRLSESPPKRQNPYGSPEWWQEVEDDVAISALRELLEERQRREGSTPEPVSSRAEASHSCDSSSGEASPASAPAPEAPPPAKEPSEESLLFGPENTAMHRTLEAFATVMRLQRELGTKRKIHGD